MKKYKCRIDLSSGDLDGSNTPAIRGGEKVCYQKRKKRKTTNSLYLTDRQGLPLAMSKPLSVNHNDLYNIQIQFEEIIGTLEKAEINVDGLFINVDTGLDSQELRNLSQEKGIMANIEQNKRNGTKNNDHYFDEKLYKERYSIERTNAWIDSFRTLLNRFDKTITSWKGFNYIAFLIDTILKRV